MARGAHHGLDGSLTSEKPSMSSLVTRISKINEGVMQGTRTSNRENDVLTQALGNKEHPGHTRGAGLVPWKLAFEGDSTTYRSCSRGKVAKEVELNQALKGMEANFEKQLEETVQVRVSAILVSRRSGIAAQKPVLTSSVLTCNSCGLTPLDNVERMSLIRLTTSPSQSVSGCTSVSNGQLTRWHSARPGRPKMG
jgi:hypothetical protein